MEGPAPIREMNHISRPCTFNGARSECYVVGINSESLTPTVTGTYTLWVDKRPYLVLRDDYRVVDNGVVGYENECRRLSTEQVQMHVGTVRAPAAWQIIAKGLAAVHLHQEAIT